jgi:NAD(P)-dependent dehydrogenase (short-subunit alcohol dehydrogenase family)
MRAAAGDPDLLVNNAGIGAAAPVEQMDEAAHRRVFETNYFGAIRMIQAVLPAMRARRGGRIVNVSSITGLVPIPNQFAYSAS